MNKLLKLLSIACLVTVMCFAFAACAEEEIDNYTYSTFGGLEYAFVNSSYAGNQVTVHLKVRNKTEASKNIAVGSYKVINTSNSSEFAAANLERRETGNNWYSYIYYSMEIGAGYTYDIRLKFNDASITSSTSYKLMYLTTQLMFTFNSSGKI